MKKTECFLIDDDRDDHELFLMVLRSIDPPIVCRVATDGPGALKTLTEETSYSPAFIFIDINMPKMDGLECLAEIRKIPRLDGAMIYMLSTSSDPRIVAASKDLGADDFLIKPSSLHNLEEVLIDVLKRSKP